MGNKSILALVFLTGCYGSYATEPAAEYETAPLSTAGAPAPAPLPEPASTCNLGGNEWGVCFECRSVHQCNGANRHRCCTDSALDGDHYSADCRGFCEPGVVPMVRNGVISCIVDLGQCGG